MSRCLVATTLFTLASSLFAPLALAEQRFAQPPPMRVALESPDVQSQDRAPATYPRDAFMWNVDRAAVRAALANRRTHLAAFRDYQRQGVFPSNTGDRTLNVWRDRAGHFCAAATIIRRSGGTALADKVAEQNNFIKLGEVTQGPVMDWILTSGFTQAEIAAIQEPFRRVGRLEIPDEIAPDLRRAEDQRLAARYRVVDKEIVERHDASLNAAVERLMQHPDLATRLVAPAPSPTPAG